jgi:nucleoid DNA-binding protein
MADELRHERRAAGRLKPGEITRISKTGAFVEKVAEEPVRGMMKVRKAALYKHFVAIAESASTDKAAANRALDALTAIVTKEVSKGGAVTLPGLGKFACRARPERMVRNPTGEAMKKPADRVAKVMIAKQPRGVVIRGHETAAPAGTGPGVTTIALAEEIERAFANARAEGKPVQIGFTIEPSGVVIISKPIIDPEPARAVPQPIAEPTIEAALSKARERGAARVGELLGGVDMKSADEFAQMIGTTRETVNQKRHRHEVLGLEGPKRGVRFPDWQLTEDGGLLPGLPELFDEIGDRPWAVYRFLVAEHPELGAMTGAEAMKRGRVAEALALAASIGRGAAT